VDEHIHIQNEGHQAKTQPEENDEDAVELVVGSRMFQARLTRLDVKARYINGEPRKYYGDVRPTASRASYDADLDRLRKC
jgi:hypothetical protein